MPEMPEVEVTRRSIDEPLRGARVLGARLGKPLRWPLGCEPEALVGCELGPTQRRGKYLWLPLERRPPQAPRRPAGATPVDETAAIAGGLLVHLGMSGSLGLHAGQAEPPGPHDHFDLVTSRGVLRLHDPRRFGAVVWSPSLHEGTASKLLAGLGAEPFDAALVPRAFHAALRRRRAPVKAVLLSGDVVVGAGNIYACEALHRAGIDPRLRSDRISGPRAARLLAALRHVLGRALELGGSTLRDFRDAHGAAGAYQAEAGVYGRAGEPCAACGTPIRRIVQAQRSTYFCPSCQKR